MKHWMDELDPWTRGSIMADYGDRRPSLEEYLEDNPEEDDEAAVRRRGSEGCVVSVGEDLADHAPTD